MPAHARVIHLRPLAWFALLSSLVSGCATDNLTSSCNGNYVGPCAPYEYAEVVEATLTPERLSVGDQNARAQIHVALQRCSEAPRPHTVELSALVSSDVTGGTRIIHLFTLEEGRYGDPVDNDGVFDLEIPNPLTAGLPTNTEITLRFEARSGPSGCTSDAFIEIPYRTGSSRP